MDANNSWLVVAGIIGGLSSIFIWIVSGIIWLIKYFRKPELIISDKPEVNKWTFSQSTTWNFAYLLVHSKNGLASLCEARVIVTEHPTAIQLPAELIEGGYGIHWADVNYSPRSTGADRIDIGSTPQRLDVAFTTPNHSNQTFVAMPIALYGLFTNKVYPTQAILPPGEYKLKIVLSCINGRGTSKTIKVVSPQVWTDLKAESCKK